MIGIESSVVSNKKAGRLAVSEVHDKVAPDMTLRLIVREVAEREGVKTPYELSKLARLPYETCRALWNEQSNMIALKTLERLCTVLKVRPSQIIEFEPEVLPAIEPQPVVKRGRPRKEKSKTEATTRRATKKGGKN
jgi:DNA-binding Xre family transcriptional regulator